jgi:hypothetical protein
MEMTMLVITVLFGLLAIPPCIESIHKLAERRAARRQMTNPSPTSLSDSKKGFWNTLGRVSQFCAGFFPVVIFAFMFSGWLWVNGLEKKFGATLSKDAPNLQCYIFQPALGRDTNSDSTIVILQLRIINTGAPSIAWNWHLKIEMPNGQAAESYAPFSPYQPLSRTINSDVGRPAINFDADKYIPNALADNPLGNGAAKTGWIVFSFPHSSQEDLNRSGNKLILDFNDRDGKKVISDIVLSPVGTHY